MRIVERTRRAAYLVGRVARAAVLFEQLVESVDVESRGVEVVDVRTAALFESRDDVGQHDDGPRRAALEEREVESGKAASDAAHQHRLGVRVTGLGEMTDVVVHVRTGRAKTDGLTTAVNGDRDTEVDAALPHRVVVVRAVDAEDVVLHAVVRRTRNVAGHERGLEAELPD